MKFGQHLLQHQFPPWQNEYIQYNQLKYFIKERPLWTQADELYFSEKLLIAELDKVNAFIHLKIKQVGNDQRKIQDLINFINLNDMGFYKILKKHDKWARPPLLNSIRFRGIHQQFQSFITHLNQLSSSSSSNKILNEEQQQGPKTTTTKYWIHLDNLTELQAILLFHLPATSSETIDTVYFDNPTDFTLYSELLERNENAEIIRARWYNNNTAEVYFERKTHHESWINNKGSSTKDRFRILDKEVNQYLSFGHYHNNPTSKIICQSMQKNSLRSTLRSYHHRTTYTADKFHLSLDTKLTFIKENSNTWRRNDAGDYPFPYLNDDVYFFPCAVLEIKSTSPNAVIPEWLMGLVETSQLVYEVPYFSKFLHGASHFYRSRLPLLPWWLGEMNIDIRTKRSYATIQSQNSGRCVVIEPPLTPDYLIVPNNTTRRLSNEDQKVYSNTASSCTMLDDSHIGLTTNSYATATQPSIIKDNSEITTTTTPYDAFLSSTIVTKIKDLVNEGTSRTAAQRDENHVGMMSWIYAKITNNKVVLHSSQYAIPTTQHQQIMPKKGKLNKKKIEPKIFFANERTFISWLQFSALLLSVSLGLINFGDHISKASGGFFIVIAMILTAYAQLRFQYRAWQIRFRGDSRFDDKYGPAVLCVVLVIALIVNLALRVNQPLPEHPSPFGKDYHVNNSLSTNNVTLNGHTVHQLANGTRVDKHGRIIQFEDGRVIEFDDDDEA